MNCNRLDSNIALFKKKKKKNRDLAFYWLVAGMVIEISSEIPKLYD